MLIFTRESSYSGRVWHNYGQLGLINAEGARQGTLKRRSHIRNGRIWRQMRAAGL